MTFFLILSALVLVSFCVWYLIKHFNAYYGKNESCNWHNLHGQWRVHYDDGEWSQPFTKPVVKSYAELFGGTVVPKCDYKKEEVDNEIS